MVDLWVRLYAALLSSVLGVLFDVCRLLVWFTGLTTLRKTSSMIVNVARESWNVDMVVGYTWLDRQIEPM
ncbi:hypothetical protein BHE74_00027781 [Ensete ventricosum]|nr:hypothetical protein BHE74_00027781 [Ensete ventricosum]